MGNVNKPVGQKSKSRVSKKYTKRQQLGCGHFSSVYLCTRKSDRAQFALKITDKRHRDPSEIKALYQEIRILQQLRHPNIIDMVEIVDGLSKTEMVLELCENGDLQSKMDQSPNGVIDEVNASKIIYILSQTLLFLHQNGVVHRDLKPENILFTKSNVLKLTDFGMSSFTDFAHQQDGHHRAHIMSTKCGTPYYAAPEIIRGRYYDEKVDCWSMGVILYWILSRVQPFECFQNLPMIYTKIVSGKYHFDCAPFDHISVAAKDLISKLLTVRRRSRLNTRGVVQHFWIQKYTKLESHGVAMNVLPDIDWKCTRQSSLGKLVIEEYIEDDKQQNEGDSTH